MISNASPLIIFGRLNRLDILKAVVGKIIIAREIYDEVVSRGIKITAPHSFLIEEYMVQGDALIHELTVEGKEKANLLEKMYSSLDSGEAATIALVLQEKQKEVLLDDHPARRVAIIQGIIPRGSLWVLLEAFQMKIITENEAKRFISQMITNGSRISARILNDFFMLLEKMKKHRK